MSRRKLTYEYVKSIFEMHGCKLLDKRYVHTKSPLKYRCKCGKLRVAVFNNFYRWPSCDNCRLLELLPKRKKKLKRLELRQKLFTISDVARMLGVSVQDFYSHVRHKKSLPAPKTKLPGEIRRYYTVDDVEKITDLINL